MTPSQTLNILQTNGTENSNLLQSGFNIPSLLFSCQLFTPKENWEELQKGIVVLPERGQRSRNLLPQIGTHQNIPTSTTLRGDFLQILDGNKLGVVPVGDQEILSNTPAPNGRTPREWFKAAMIDFYSNVSAQVSIRKAKTLGNPSVTFPCIVVTSGETVLPLFIPNLKEQSASQRNQCSAFEKVIQQVMAATAGDVIDKMVDRCGNDDGPPKDVDTIKFPQINTKKILPLFKNLPPKEVCEALDEFSTKDLSLEEIIERLIIKRSSRSAVEAEKAFRQERSQARRKEGKQITEETMLLIVAAIKINNEIPEINKTIEKINELINLIEGNENSQETNEMGSVEEEENENSQEANKMGSVEKEENVPSAEERKEKLAYELIKALSDTNMGVEQTQKMLNSLIKNKVLAAGIKTSNTYIVFSNSGLLQDPTRSCNAIPEPEVAPTI